jgi:hypothetical protein
MTPMRRLTSLEALWRGALAGVAGTVAMDAYGYVRFRAQGGDAQPLLWEFGGASKWDAVSAPAQVGRRLYEGYLQRPLDERWARLTNNVMHWGYGIAWGAAFGIVAGSAPHQRFRFGPALGVTVWASSYVLLPIAGLYKPIWQYSIDELAPDLIAHLASGTAAASAYRMLPSARIQASV